MLPPLFEKCKAYGTQKAKNWPVGAGLIMMRDLNN